jgi:hypothetical protein
MTPKPNQYIALATHPFLDCVDGTRDLVIRKKGLPKSQIIPLLDHHEYETEPLGFAELAFIPCAEISETEELCVVTALITTNKALPTNQSVSIGAPVERVVGKYQIYSDIIELSLVDKGHLNGAAVIEFENWNSVIRSLYQTAPTIVMKIVKDLSNA